MALEKKSRCVHSQQIIYKIKKNQSMLLILKNEEYPEFEHLINTVCNYRKYELWQLLVKDRVSDSLKICLSSKIRFISAPVFATRHSVNKKHQINTLTFNNVTAVEESL